MLKSYIVTPPSLDEDDDDYLNDGPVECEDCGDTFPESALHNGICAGCCFKRPNYWEEEGKEDSEC